MKAFFAALAVVAVVSAAPALYFGAKMAQHFNRAELFVLPVLFCILIAALAIGKFEE